MSSIHTARLATPKSSLMTRIAGVNQELWLLLSMFLIAGLINWLVAPYKMLLGLYMLPTLLSAYAYGRKHAVLTASASILIVVLLAIANPALLSGTSRMALEEWSEFTTWGGLLLVTAYLMGTLYERLEGHLRELRRTYFGVLAILQQLISNDKYTHNHCHRVAIYAVTLAQRMKVDDERIDDIRAAALLHDIGKLESSREPLSKAANLGEGDAAAMARHIEKRPAMLEPIGGSLRRVIPIIMAHHDDLETSHDNVLISSDTPLEARILAVADAYDTLTSDRPYRRAVTPFEARDIIMAGSGKNFDSAVVEIFRKAFDHGEMEIPESLQA